MTTTQFNLDLPISTIQICKHCGNDTNNHRFRHIPEPITVILSCDSSPFNPHFTLNADDFQPQTRISCSVPDCSAPKALHNTDIIKHTFSPQETKFRTIRFRLPPDILCSAVVHDRGESSLCSTSVSNHDTKGQEKTRHKFTVSVQVLNKTKDDVVKIFRQFEDDTGVTVIEPKNTEDDTGNQVPGIPSLF